MYNEMKEERKITKRVGGKNRAVKTFKLNPSLGCNCSRGPPLPETLPSTLSTRPL